MSVRFPVFILILLIGLGSVGYGLYGNGARVYDKPDPRDDQTVLNDEFSRMAGEIELTALVSRMSLDRHEETDELVDLAISAPCQS
jgi:hypothetical protein